jgi:hypothetical protein
LRIEPAKLTAEPVQIGEDRGVIDTEKIQPVQETRPLNAGSPRSSSKRSTSKQARR